MASPSSSAIPPSFSNFQLPLLFQRPGLNVPLNWVPQSEKKSHIPENASPARGEGKNLFRTALNQDDIRNGITALPLITLRELTMLRIMNVITDKVGWEKKVFDDTIAGKWKTEAMATEGQDVTENMMDWVIAELRYKAKIYTETGTVNVFTGDVVKSDTAIPTPLKEALRAAAGELEFIPEIYKDYHPGSDGKVVDLVHPSLFPLIYGRSRVLDDKLIGIDDCIESCGKGKIIPVPGEAETELLSTKARYSWETAAKPYSRNFQWLPCEVDISNEKVKITSYINNLHPRKYPTLYKVIEDVISKAIPLWNKSITPLRENITYRRIQVRGLEFDPDPDEMDDEEKPQQLAGENENDFWNRRWEWECAIRRAVIPDAEEFEPPEPYIDFRTHEPSKGVDLYRDYGHRGLQIIVKLANIELTPSKPSYGGGSWHVEGAMNEHIIATALYYYDSQNISESRLAFRQQSSTDDADELGYPQGVHEWLSEIYGCQNDTPALQEVGSVLCTEGRLITFPNILQHQVQPFELVDKTKPGHRKILALFLVDPGIRIISTANVPPQQREWWAEEVEKQMLESGKALGKLSRELMEQVFEEVDDFPIGMDDAKEVRGRLMEERTGYVQVQNEAFENQTFSLCEH